ncbi:MAG: Lactyl (2) diphospho-(5')guanosine:7,8-didemethyl-8-hydroxy-5-deazariboflavin 2-phospho-L-lactate transferase [uncultured Corynebacteriales bacterium]|uniref:Lactyl (2) diphospho-(5')guanosine:7,8-didemethyl-8-hydroxy-5-deazarib oflavin 2-phospho-L-lactate transferase n=1 Tax=uncultured Mycobacteriales bacterium TaxID=581187 RepID=A0A6J4JHT5_9ACTN|nr:MAG: Lactyl (2) diphospho-(5')guanosine:7,8-didemethyl-8-hydroxy-5-deazariboflavin 2-phospho-L-lactate transferase [uncultured Corynebacteriales bacterium]
MGCVRVVVVAGGIGGARFLRGVRAAIPDAEVTALVNTGDDLTVHGMRVCPDLDTVMYTLGDGIDRARGWGRDGESWRVKDELAAYGADPAWFGLGDLDLATHLIRTRMLDAGYPLSAVTEALCARWRPGVRLLPMSDDRVETHVLVDAEPGPADAPRTGGGRRAIHFQEWWVRHRATLPAYGFVQVGLEAAKPAAGVLDALATADAILLAPSNPVVSIGTVLAVPGIRDAVRAAPGQVVGLSPIVAGAPVRGMADACLTAIGVATTAEAVGRRYGSRAWADGVLDGWLVDTADAAARVPGVRVEAVPLLMTDEAATTAMARAALTLAGV